jgi:peroxiredoxin
LQIIGITYPLTNRAQVRNFSAKNKINYPVLFGSKRTKALFDKGNTMPYSVVIDKDGNIRARIEGVIFDDEFDVKIKALLESGSERKDMKNQ